MYYSPEKTSEIFSIMENRQITGRFTEGWYKDSTFYFRYLQSEYGCQAFWIDGDNICSGPVSPGRATAILRLTLDGKKEYLQSGNPVWAPDYHESPVWAEME